MTAASGRDIGPPPGAPALCAKICHPASGACSTRGNVDHAAGMPECAMIEVSRPFGKGV